jgi:hypothetical protein
VGDPRDLVHDLHGQRAVAGPQHRQESLAAGEPVRSLGKPGTAAVEVPLVGVGVLRP